MQNLKLPVLILLGLLSEIELNIIDPEYNVKKFLLINSSNNFSEDNYYNQNSRS